MLREHCDRLGRDYDSIIKSTNIELDLTHTSAQTIDQVTSVLEAGADYVNFYIPRVAYDHEPLLRLAAEVVPQFS